MIETGSGARSGATVMAAFVAVIAPVTSNSIVKASLPAQFRASDAIGQIKLSRNAVSDVQAG
jgi:multisubunit Na+/H+ antiporter MnhG subunit